MALDWHFHPFLFLFITFTLQFSLTSSVSESESLIRLKKSFTNAGAISSWLPGSVPCNKQTHWRGVVCFNGIVTGLQLENMGLSGTIDVDALANLQGLRSVSFAYNYFTGTIPALNRLGYLKAVYLTGNQFSGEIPSDFFLKMKSLKKVWISDNNFSGGIPSSLAELSRLSELHLENNQFSGTIPSIDQPTLMSFNVSNNKLDGEIPPNFARFNSSSFRGNDGLCGEKIGKGCELQGSSEPPTDVGVDANMMVSDNKRNSVAMTVAGLVTLAVLLVSVIAVVIFRMRRRGKDFDAIEHRSSGDAAALEAQVSLSNRPKEMEVAKKMGSGRKGSNNGRGVVGELVFVNNEKSVFGLPDLMKASAEVLGNGVLGSSYKTQMANGVVVVVKRMREMNTLSKSDRGPSHDELSWSVRLKIVQGIAKGLGYLHTELAPSNLPHGNLKSSNVFLSNDNEPLLSEFGLSPLISPPLLAQALFGYEAPEAAEFGVSPNSKNSRCQKQLLGIGAACVKRNPEQRLDITQAIQLIQEIELEDGDCAGRTTQVLPSLRDGYADAS
ncbi:hypothetical protein D5086_006460 [Populus alba]|uniref:Uncharacterized protein n=1 Tax=Populus alba TaxID=43335 RepID=A0ACC4CM62_POPAL